MNKIRVKYAGFKQIKTVSKMTFVLRLFIRYLSYFYLDTEICKNS